jgi:CheY-like chemotaxis protein
MSAIRNSEETFVGPRVFIVEDEEAVRDLWIEAFQEAGCVVAAAHCGAEALVRLREFRADVIVTDLAMPGMDGGELIALLRQEPALREVPVVVITALAYGLPPDRTELAARRAGVVDVVAKTVDLTEMVERVMTAARTRVAPDPPGLRLRTERPVGG